MIVFLKSWNILQNMVPSLPVLLFPFSFISVYFFIPCLLVAFVLVLVLVCVFPFVALLCGCVLQETSRSCKSHKGLAINCMFSFLSIFCKWGEGCAIPNHPPLYF